MKQPRRLSLRRRSAYAAAVLGALILVLVLLTRLLGGAMLNGYAKQRMERAFALAYPGCALHIGQLDYAVGANRLVAQSVILHATNATLTIGRLALEGVRWPRLLGGTPVLAQVLEHARLEAAHLDAEFPQAHYGLRCARLRASVPGSELVAEGTELRPLGGDEAFFAAHPYRTARFRVIAPECRVLGLAYGDALRGTSYRARSVHFPRPTFDALVNRDKPSRPFERSPLMVHEALAAIPQPLHVDRLSLTDGHLTYCQRLADGADPAVLTFGAVTLSVEGIANRGDAAAAISLQGHGDLMNAGTLTLRMAIPITPSDFSLRYSGSLSAMDLTRLDAFLDQATHTRIKSGRVQEAAFDIEVLAGQASGRVHAIYSDLVIAVLDKHTGTPKGLDNRLVSFLANALKVRNANAPNASGSSREGTVSYTRQPEDQFLGFLWFALRTGVLDIISH